MNKINRKLEYALIALKHMLSKSPGELTTVKEISQRYGSPFDVTSRVLQVLAGRGILRSEQGAHGGYQIQKDLSRVTVYDLTETIIGPIGIAKCQQDDPESPCEIQQSCIIHSPMQILNRKLIDFYKNLTVMDLFEQKVNSRSSPSLAPTVDSGLVALQVDS